MEKIISLFMVLMMALGCGFTAHQIGEPSKAVGYTITESYVYPILPGSEEWRNFETADERVDAWYYLGQEYLKIVQCGDRLLDEIVLVILLEQPEFNGPLFGWTQWGGEDCLLTVRALVCDSLFSFQFYSSLLE